MVSRKVILFGCAHLLALAFIGAAAALAGASADSPDRAAAAQPVVSQATAAPPLRDLVKERQPPVLATCGHSATCP